MIYKELFFTLSVLGTFKSLLAVSWGLSPACPVDFVILIFMCPVDCRMPGDEQCHLAFCEGYGLSLNNCRRRVSKEDDFSARSSIHSSSHHWNLMYFFHEVWIRFLFSVLSFSGPILGCCFLVAWESWLWNFPNHTHTVFFWYFCWYKHRS